MVRPPKKSRYRGPQAGTGWVFASAALVLLAALLWLPLAALAQAPPEVEPVNEQVIADLAAQVEQSADLTDPAREELSSRLKNASRQLQQAAEFAERRRKLESIAAGAQEAVAQFQQQLAQAQAAPPDPAKVVPPEADVARLESEISLLRADRKTLEERQAAILQEVQQRPTRRAAAEARLAEVRSAITANRPSAEMQAATLEEQVVKAAARARQRALNAEAASLEAEVVTEPARADVNAAERAWLSQALADTDLRLQALTRAAEAARDAASRRKLEATAELAQQAQGEDPAVRALAEGNRALAERLRPTAERTERARADAREMSAQLDGVEQGFSLMQRRLEAAGRKDVLAGVMITSMNSLPDVTAIDGDTEARNDLISETSITYIDLDEELRALSRRGDYLADLGLQLESLDPSAVALVDKALDQRRQLLENGLEELGVLQSQLIDNNRLADRLIAATAQYREFLMGNLLWVRNFSYFDLDILKSQLRQLLSPFNWLALPEQFYRGFRRSTWGEVLVLGLVVFSLLAWQLRRPINHLVRRPTTLSGESLLSMLLGIAGGVLLVLPWPFALWLLAYTLQVYEPDTLFTEALTSALYVGGRILLAVLFVRRMIHPRGVGRRMLKWNVARLDAFRTELRWAGPLLVLTAALNSFAFHLNVVVSGGPLGAICTAVITLTVIVVCARLLRQKAFSDQPMARLVLRLPIAMGAIILVMQLLGLLFAAETFMRATGRTVFFVFVVTLLIDVAKRWLLILRGRLERRKREELKAREHSGEELPQDAEAWVDMVSLSEAHNKLLGLVRAVAILGVVWFIWAPALPGLNLLEGVTLWQVVDAADPEGGLRPVTLADLLFSLATLAVTILLARHLPSVLRAFMLEWFKVSAGARYASGILFQYFVLAVGGSIFLSTLGWEWSKVQWLVAALGVGIGFGLQEIVANFISGIIILFERPVRVGDIISVAGAEGTVLEIKPRATLIETFEQKEVLIPNKELITGQVVNWSLTGDATRMLIPVGVAYGSDVRRAQALILEAAQEVKLVLPEPAPVVSFDDFGDNALLLVLRCYAAEQRVQVWTDLRNLINDKLAAEGIEIAFPQRSVHLDTTRPLQIELRHVPGDGVDGDGRS